MATVVERISGEEALQRTQKILGDRVTRAHLNFGQVDVTCDPERLVDVVTTLRDDPNLSCEFFTFLSGVDRSEFGGGKEESEGEEPSVSPLEVLVHLYSPSFVWHVNIHVPVDAAAPVCPSITTVFRGANWQERETHEMFGVDFEGHPRLVNLYLPEDFEGHPLRRAFKLPSRIVKEWPGAKDPEEAAAGGR